MTALVAGMRQDVRYAARALWRSPAFTATAVVVLALAISGVTAVFSLVDAALLRPAGLHDPSRLVVLWSSDPARGAPLVELSFPDALDIRSGASSLTNAAAYGSSSWTLVMTGAGDPVTVAFAGVSGTFFDVVGARPMLGRPIVPSDDRAGAPPVIVISHRLWQDRFGGRADAIGRTVTLDRLAGVVVGVMGPDFGFPAGVDAWEPLSPYLHTVMPPPALANLRAVGFLYMVGRLAPGETVDTCRRDVTRQIRLLHEHYERRAYGDAVVTPLVDHVLGPTRPALFVASAAVALVLLAAWANVAGLMLVRGAGRDREIAVRLALGASNARAASLPFAESVLLCAAATAAALLVAKLSLPGVIAMMPADLAGFRRASIDPRAFAMAVAAGVLCVIVTAAVPIAASLNVSLGDRLKRRSMAVITGGRRRHALIAAEIALTISVMILAALAIRSFVNLTTLDLGFRPEGVLLVRAPSGEPSGAAHQRAFAERLRERLASLPGVAAIGAVSVTPLEFGPIGDDRPVQIEGGRPAAQGPSVNYLVATPGYFGVMGIRLVSGRLFTEADAQASAPVAIVSEATARRLWPGQNAIGRRLRVMPGTTPVTVVGIVASGRTRQLGDAALDFYAPGRTAGTWVLRSAGNPLALAASVRALIRQLDGSRAITIERLDRRVDAARLPWRTASAAMGLFAAIALLLALTGVHGLVAYAVSTEAREFGVRVALGATPRRVLHLVAWRVARPAIAGIAIGVPLAMIAARVMSALLFGVSSVDPASYAGAVIVLLLSVAAACAPPARRAASIDPMSILRAE